MKLRLLIFAAVTTIVVAHTDRLASAAGRAAQPSRDGRGLGPDNPFGITVGVGLGENGAHPDSLFSALAAANIGWLRIAATWSDAEPDSGNFSRTAIPPHIRRLIAVLQNARRHGLHAYLAIPTFAPRFAKHPADSNMLKWPDCRHFAAWKRYVENIVAVVDTIGVTHFSIGNEPPDTTQSYQCFRDSAPNWGAATPRDGKGWIEDYTELVRRASDAIKARNPNHKVIVWENGSQGPYSTRSLIPLLQYSLSRLKPSAVDIIAVHGYSFHRNGKTYAQDPAWVDTGAYHEMDHVFAPAFRDKELWLTEFGGEPRSSFSERDQRNVLAAVVQGFTDRRTARNWTKIFAFSALDDDVDYRLVNGFYAEKPARPMEFYEGFVAYSYFARRWASRPTGSSSPARAKR